MCRLTLAAASRWAAVAVAFLGSGCGRDDPVAVVQGERMQIVTRLAACTEVRVFGGACSRRSYPRTLLDAEFDPRVPLSFTFAASARVEISAWRPRRGRDREAVVWRDERQCIDSACVREIRLTDEQVDRLSSGDFLRVVMFGEQRRGFELALDASRPDGDRRFGARQATASEPERNVTVSR